MRDIIKSTSKLSVPTVINLISSVIRNKLLAVIVGPVGLGVYSQLFNLSALMSSVLPIGSIGLVRYISNFFEDKRQKEINFFLIYFLKRNFILSLACTTLLVIFYRQLSDLLFADSALGNLIILFSLFIPLNLILNFIDIYFRGIRNINKYVLFLSLNSISSTVIAVPLIYYWGLVGAVLTMVLTVIISIANGLIILKKEKLFPGLSEVKSVQRSDINNIYKMGFASMLALIAQHFTILAIKSSLALKLGLHDVGVFQCVFSISSGYFGIFFSLIGTYSIPKVSTLKSSSEINSELNSTLKFLMLLYTPLIITMFAGRTLIISALYSSDFLEARHLLIFQLPAELIRALSWVFGLWLIPTMKIKQWLIFDLIFYSLFFLIFYCLLNFLSFGIESANIAYLIAYFIFMIINLLYSINSIEFRLTKSNFILLVTSVIFISAIFSISYFSEFYGYFAVLPVLILWTIVFIKKQDFDKLKDLLRGRISKQ